MKPIEESGFSLLFDATPVAMLLVDRNHRIVYTNPAAHEFLGYGAGQLHSLSVHDLVFSRYDPIHQEKRTQEHLWRRKADPGHPPKPLLLGDNRELVARTADGQELPVKSRVSTLATAEGDYNLVVLLDLSWQRKTENALQLSDATYRAAIETALDGFCVLDTQGRIQEVNEAYLQRSGFSREELQESTAALLLADVDNEGAGSEIDKLTRPRSELYETRLRCKDGSIWQAEIKKSYWPVRDGRIFICMRDITQHKLNLAKIQASRNEMVRLLQQQVAIHTASAIAHELNQPLNAITTYNAASLMLLRDNAPDPQKLEKAIESSAEQAQRAGRVVRELLKFLRHGDVSTEPLNLNHEVLDALELLENDGYAGFTPLLQLDPDLPLVRANHIQVQKVLSNLLYNSVEAMRETGMPDSAITITLRTMAEQDMAQLTVQDNGPGISPEIAKRIFEPFITTKSNGTGFGLAVSRTLIEAMGGRLWVDHDAAPGATFHMTLPFA